MPGTPTTQVREPLRNIPIFLIIPLRIYRHEDILRVTSTLSLPHRQIDERNIVEHHTNPEQPNLPLHQITIEAADDLWPTRLRFTRPHCCQIDPMMYCLRG